MTSIPTIPRGARDEGHKTLGFMLVFRGKKIEHGIELYKEGGLDRKSVKEYWLEESDKDLWRGHTKVAGKKLLYIHKEALRKVFVYTGGEGGEQVSDEMEECIGRI
jgi:hypothetical protein